MKKFSKITALLFAAICIIDIAGPVAALAATTPSLGAAATYGVLSSTYANTSAGMTVNGDVGFTTPPAVAPLGVHTNYGSGSPYAAAGTDQGSALSSLAAQPCTFTFAPGAVNLSTDTTHGPITVYTPGVYCSAGAMNVGGPLVLNGSGTYIFRPDGALTTTAGAVVTLNSASSCNVFWTPSAATTFGANTTFAGSVISNAGITIGANTTWTGRSLAFGGTVTSDTDTITVPSCTLPPQPPVVVVSTTTTAIAVTPIASSSTSTPTIVIIATSTPAVIVAPVQTPVVSTPVVVVPLASTPNTGRTASEELVWYILYLILPSFVVATLGSLYLFRKRA